MKDKLSVITKEEFVTICKDSKTKIEAYKRMHMYNNTFAKYLKLFDIDFDEICKKKINQRKSKR